jgi:hypothetical protein
MLNCSQDMNRSNLEKKVKSKKRSKFFIKIKKSLSNIILNVLYVITRIHIHLNHVCELDTHRKLYRSSGKGTSHAYRSLC